MTKFATVLAIFGFLAFTAPAQAFWTTDIGLAQGAHASAGHWRQSRPHYAKAHRGHPVAHVARRNWDKSTGNTTSLEGYPTELVQKTHEITTSCGSKIISAFRPGSMIGGHLSNHAIKRAVDIAGNPSCIYAHLKGWPGGYSVDYAAVQHVHVSYNPRMEWGARFVHRGGGPALMRGIVNYQRRRHFAHA
jgi:hypothetical protein